MTNHKAYIMCKCTKTPCPQPNNDNSTNPDRNWQEGTRMLHNRFSTLSVDNVFTFQSNKDFSHPLKEQSHSGESLFPQSNLSS